VASDSDTFDMFLREVAKDMTQKAGQKCTAIRRIFVPEASADEAVEALSNEVSLVKVGDPRAKGVRMGPLATRAQLEDVAAGIDRLRSCAEFAHGDGGRGELVEVEGEKGYFLSPTLLRAKSADGTDVVHEHEVFGPVATVVPYSGDAAEAVALVQRGQGGLVSSVYSDDRAFVEELVLGIAPFHGRITVGSARVAEHSPGPGTVMPALVHGGPGRAGGGEELGGLRGMAAYMQRTAVQGAKPLLQKVLDAADS
jgi:oxepin-CoA hydrolase/3-oxo-5,6-dehydrosuberyl-CoA semialdehyde dehydrogenase